MRHKVLWLSIFLGLSGCRVGPDYRAPDPVLPDRWKAARDPANALKPVSENALKTW